MNQILQDGGPMPRRRHDETALFDCDLFLFTALPGCALGSLGRRRCAVPANRDMLRHYARLAPVKTWSPGLFCQT
ncbi:MAG: hypothetical protein ACLU9S_11695 [Oscillospiraceae bacterium]